MLRPPTPSSHDEGRQGAAERTSHYFGDKFSKAYDVTFTGRDNQLHHPYQTSWGVSTRLVGAIIMTHATTTA